MKYVDFCPIISETFLDHVNVPKRNVNSELRPWHYLEFFEYLKISWNHVVIQYFKGNMNAIAKKCIYVTIEL